MKVVISIEEGMPDDIVAVNGTIIKPLKAPNGGDCWLVSLDRRVVWGAATGLLIGKSALTLEQLAIWPVFQGDTIERILTKDHLVAVPCGIANLLDKHIGDTLPDRSRLVYFSRGSVKRA